MADRTALSRIRLACLGATALTGLLFIAGPAGAVDINDNFTPAQAVDPVNITGVGQMVIDEQNGFIGLCTVSLINPRTVLFASHCVNENPAGSGFMPATGYGAANGGLPIGFFFNANNNQAGNSAIGQWLNGVSGGPRDLTRPGSFAYNSNFVVYNTNCCTLGLGNNFLQSDVAIAALDTPAVGIPTFTTLFSALTAPAHSIITGYGDNGTGTSGQGTIDFKRRVAENIVSVLGSLDDQDKFLFGAPDGLPANLYMMDFNDPKFNTAQANAFDFNIFHDVALPREGITAPGDSGGPLLIDHAFTQNGAPATTIAGVLSGGDRFFNAQKGASYGTTSFYQPLYLYWDWIVANNPYKYVGNKAGDGAWTDASHWQMNLDPAYVTADANGNLVNALPTTPAQGQADIPPGFGEVCYFNDCIDIKTGVHTNPTPPATPGPTGGAQPFGGVLGQAGFDALVQNYVASLNGGTGQGAAQVSITSIDGVSAEPALASGGSILSGAASAQSNWTNPEGTALVNGVAVQGAPGSSPGQAPNDTNGNAAAGVPARYYDVTLAAAGTTTLSGASITIDNLTINGASTALTIAAGASLTSLININSFAGTTTVNGTLTGANGVSLFGGVLAGSGTVNGNVGSLLGAIAPGTVGTVGTLTINGNLGLGLGSTFVIDLSSALSDKLVVNGTAAVNGTVAASFGAGSYFVGERYTLLTSSGALSGSFAQILTPGSNIFGGTLSYDANNVFLTVMISHYLWGTSPATSDWNTAANWQPGVVPGATDTAEFGATTGATVSVSAPTSVKAIQFNADAPAYNINITGTAAGAASLTLTAGITDASSGAKTVTASGVSGKTGTLAFTVGGNAADAILVAGAFGTVSFAGNADAGTSATLQAQSGGTFDFTATTGASGGAVVTAGSIAGAGNFVLGANTLQTGTLNASTTVSGVISGTGGLVQTGTGTLTLTGTNTYTGGTGIAAGSTLQIGSGGTSGSITGNVIDNGVLIFNRSDNTSFGAVIGGTGAITKTGAGTLTLSGTSTFTGATAVNNGILSVTGSIGSSSGVTLASGTSLIGTGTVARTTAASGSAIAPGVSGIGTLTFTGNVTQAAGSSLAIETSGAASDKLVVAGALAEGGTVTISAIAGYTPHYGDTGVIAAATTITGFGTVTDNLVGALRPVVSIINVSGGQQAVYSIAADSFLTQFTATSSDQTQIAAALDGGRAAHYADLKPLYDALDTLTNGDLAGSLENLAPDAERTIGMVDQMATDNYVDMMRGRLGEVGHTPGAPAPAAGLRVDSTGLGIALKQVSTASAGAQPFLQMGDNLVSNTSSLTNTPAATGDKVVALPYGMGGFITGRSLSGSVAVGGGGGKAAVGGYMIGGGLDLAVTDNFIIGGSMAIAQTTTRLQSAGTLLRSNFTQGGMYARYDSADDVFVTGYFAIDSESVRLNRSVVTGATTFNLTGATQGASPSFGLTAGKAFAVKSDDTDNPLVVTPSIGIQYQHSGLDAFTETGGAAAMTFSKFSNDAPSGELGVDLKKIVDLTGIRLLPSLHLGWVNALGSGNGTVQAAFAAIPTALMTFSDASRTQSYGEIGVGTGIDISETLGSPASLAVRYNGTFGRQDVSYSSWMGELKIAF